MRARVLVAAAVASMGLLPILGQGAARAAECVGTGVVNTPALQWSMLGTPNSGSLSGSVGGCSVSGNISGSCDNAAGNMSLNGRGTSFVIIGTTIHFTGSQMFGSGRWEPVVGQSCSPPSSATQFQLTLVVSDTTPPTVTVPTIPSVTVPTIPPLGGGPASNSTGCLGTPLHETSTPVYTKLATYNPNATTTYLCVRVADTPTGNGYGGRLEITTGGGGLPNPGVPTTDTDYDECALASNNTAPGPRPLLRGQTGGVPYEVGIYQGPGVSGNGEVWVCLQAGSAQHRVKIPTGGLNTPGLPNVAWRPDTGTPG
jgi:hypothetical protein